MFPRKRRVPGVKSGRVRVCVTMRLEFSNVVLLAVTTEVADIGKKNQNYHRVGDRMPHMMS